MSHSPPPDLGSSFFDYARRVAPEILPDGRRPVGEVGPHGTTIVAATCADGAVMVGDRRATLGNYIAQRTIEKVFGADDYSIIGVAGVAGFAVELVRLFQVELAHYEKIEGAPLSLDGKANRLAGMLRAQLELALQGLAAVPVLAGWDAERGLGRLFSYDVGGGRYEESGYHAVGSGGPFARGSLKRWHRPDMSEREAVIACLQSLVDSADEDSATAGLDTLRRIYPIVMTVGPAGARRLPEAELAGLVDEIMNSRRRRPDGPEAPLV